MNLGHYHTHYDGSGSWVGYIPKCKARLGYQFILGPLFQQHSHPGPYHTPKCRLRPSSEQGMMEVLCANTSPLNKHRFANPRLMSQPCAYLWDVLVGWHNYFALQLFLMLVFSPNSSCLSMWVPLI
jgi:hypothetical protein